MVHFSEADINVCDVPPAFIGGKRSSTRPKTPSHVRRPRDVLVAGDARPVVVID
jgi:hypothetical protein